MEIKMNYPINKIKIPMSFSEHPPKKEKVNQKAKILKSHPEQIYITITNKDTLIDGYATYLAAVDLGYNKINVRQLDKGEAFEDDKTTAKTYVWGIHPGDENKIEYVWRIPENKQHLIDKIKVGDKIMVQTKYGPAPVNVTKIQKKNYPPVATKIRRVIGFINN